MQKTNFIAFVLGAAVGVAATFTYAKKKYERIAQEEIDSVKANFSSRPKYEGPETSDEEDDAQAKAKMIREKGNIMEYAALLGREGYTDYSTTSVKKPDIPTKKPFVISPDEFGEDEEYTKIELTYYADQVLADDDDSIVENVEELVGFDSLTRFGEYEDDSVFVQNDERRCYYAILLDQRRYSDVLEDKPYKAEV